MYFLVGDLVKWVSEWHTYAADPNGVSVNGEVPIYSYGIVLESYMEKRILVVYCSKLKMRQLVNLELMDCEIISAVERQWKAKK